MFRSLRNAGFILAALLLLSLAVSSIAANELTVKRERSVMREGPGSFFAIVSEFSVGEVVNLIEEEDDWFKVSYLSLDGYISPRILEAAPPRTDIFSRMADSIAGTEASRHVMSAGIKGFGEHFSQTFKGDETFIDYALDYSINPREYRRFKRDTYRGINLRRLRRDVSIPVSDVPGFYSEVEEGLGLGIASRIARLGLYRDFEVVDYVNYVGNLVVEGSEVFDNSFKFFILDIENPNAYACPGGIIFITKGMLRVIRNEAELALVLAHEVAHSARFHGIIEMEQRQHQIGSELAFDEMDRHFDEFLPDAVSQDVKELIEEMNQEAFKIFETLIQGRLDQYEEEADFLGMIYAVRAGYDPQVFLSLLNRLLSEGHLSNNEHYTQESNKMRSEKMQRNIKKIDIPSGLLINSERYRSVMIRL
jgi:hypothetical protein